jgi:3',5'-cyclic AMP phosphodiesterase CpdA
MHGDYVTFLEEVSLFRENGISVHCVMGNHDNRQAFLEVIAKMENKKKPTDIPDRLYSIIETSKANIFLLDSLKPNTAYGLLGKEQIDWLAHELDLRNDKPAILFAHHYPEIFRTSYFTYEKTLNDTALLFETIKERKHVKAYIFGHSHVWRYYNKYGIHFINLPTTAWSHDPDNAYAYVFMKLNTKGCCLILRRFKEKEIYCETLELTWR